MKEVKCFDNTGALLYPPAILILDGTEDSVEKAKEIALDMLSNMRESRIKLKRGNQI